MSDEPDGDHFRGLKILLAIAVLAVAAFAIGNLNDEPDDKSAAELEAYQRAQCAQTGDC